LGYSFKCFFLFYVNLASWLCARGVADKSFSFNMYLIKSAYNYMNKERTGHHLLINVMDEIKVVIISFIANIDQFKEVFARAHARNSSQVPVPWLKTVGKQ